MNVLGVSEARSKFAKLINTVDEQFERLYITKNGKTKAVLLSSDEFESWIETLASYQDEETRTRNKELKNLDQELLTLDQLKQKL